MAQQTFKILIYSRDPAFIEAISLSFKKEPAYQFVPLLNITISSRRFMMKCPIWSWLNCGCPMWVVLMSAAR